jgi:hypothetical protein
VEPSDEDLLVLSLPARGSSPDEQPTPASERSRETVEARS